MATVTYQHLPAASDVATASWTGDGAIQTVTFGFTPTYIRIINHTDNISYEWNQSAPSGQLCKLTAAGATSQLATAAGLTTISATGFSLAAAENVNAKVFSCMVFH